MQNEAELEKLVCQWEDRRELQNLMGRHTFALLMKQEPSVFDRFWSTSAPDVCLTLNGGYYEGQQGVRSYYEAEHEKNLARTRRIMAEFPRETEGRTEEELYGCGVQNQLPICNRILEIAKDRKTAKAFWYVLGKTDEYGEDGPLSYWTFGMFGVDFLLEGDDWRIWHLTYFEDIHTPCGTSWCEAPQTAELPNGKYFHRETLHEVYSTSRKPGPGLPLPVPYKTFHETFSYGR